MKNYSHLGAICKGVLSIIEFEMMERSIIYDELRKSHYKSSTPKSRSRQSIKRAIKTLKQRGIVEEYGNYIGLKNEN
jgi:hypothetical protein